MNTDHTTKALRDGECSVPLSLPFLFFFFLAFAVYTIKAALEMNDVVFSSSCLQPKSLVVREVLTGHTSSPVDLQREHPLRPCPVVRSPPPQGQFVCWLVGCLTSHQHASVSLGQICSDNLTCCHTEIQVADQTSYLTQSQYTDTGPTSPSADPITPGAWQGSHWSEQF